MTHRSRNRDRIRLRVEGQIHGLPSGPFAIEVLDASQLGCGLESPHVLPIGGEVVLEMAALPPVRGTIAWQLGTRAGIRFHEPISDAALFYLRLQTMLKTLDAKDTPSPLRRPASVAAPGRKAAVRT